MGRRRQRRSTSGEQGRKPAASGPGRAAGVVWAAAMMVAAAAVWCVTVGPPTDGDGMGFDETTLTTAAAKAKPDRGWVPRRPSRRWTCIVIHHSATDVGGADRFDRAHRDRGWDSLGYHFVVGNGSDTADGKVEVGPRWREQKHGAHCRTDDEHYNEHGIGVCLVGDFDKARPTAAQTKSLTRLVRHLCREYDISASRIYTHGGVTGKTNCPGRRFDLKKLRAAVRKAG